MLCRSQETISADADAKKSFDVTIMDVEDESVEQSKRVGEIGVQIYLEGHRDVVSTIEILSAENTTQSHRSHVDRCRCCSLSLFATLLGCLKHSQKTS
jgi:hypothetical protein